MGSILAMKRRFEQLNTDQVIYLSVQETEEDIKDLNREQMYDGKTNEGTDITPSYLQDPYFQGDRQRAQAYSDWKDKITPNPRRNPGTPNLFINGYFYSTIDVLVFLDKITFRSRFDDQNEISNKFKNIYGLGGNIKRIYLDDYLKPILKEKMQDATGLKMGV